MPFEPTHEQAAIINHDIAQHARVLAGPGTGKSSTLVALLTKTLNENPLARVKMLTFTRAATAELAKKVPSAGIGAQQPSTIHSFAISILLRNPGTAGFPEPLRIADTWEMRKIVEPTLAARVGVGVRLLRDLVWEMGANWESLTDEADPGIAPDLRARFRGAWAEHRQVMGYTLLQELPYALRQALNDHDDLAGLDYDIVLVDEYQDLNSCDLEAIRLLSEKGGATIIGTGDDDQSIYSWRKAAPQGIRRFLEDFAGARDYTLSKTLRCGKRIIDWANDVIRGDPARPQDRAVLDCLDGAPEGEVALLSFKNELEEAGGVAALIEWLIDHEEVAPAEILVLVRGDHNGTFSTPIRDALQDRGIECYNADFVVELLNEEANRRFVEIARLLVRRDDSLAWASLFDLAPGIGSKFFDYVYGHALANRQSFSDALFALREAGYPKAPSGSGKKAEELVNAVVAFLNEHSVPATTPDSGWVPWVLAMSGNAVFPQPSPPLVEVMGEVILLLEPDCSFAKFLSMIEPLGKDCSLAHGKGVRIMTMSGSKGLTVRATIIVGAEEGIVPRPEADLGEERRIMYVAMTRAREYLFCTWARRRRGPTARAGKGTLLRRRQSHFLEAGPVTSQDGSDFLSAIGG